MSAELGRREKPESGEPKNINLCVYHSGSNDVGELEQIYCGHDECLQTWTGDVKDPSSVHTGNRTTQGTAVWTRPGPREEIINSGAQTGPTHNPHLEAQAAQQPSSSHMFDTETT